MKNFLIYWQLIMGMVLIFMGIMVMMSPPQAFVEMFKETPYLTSVAGFVIMMYGGFRFYRGYVMVRK